jgi:hypothetical protein
VFDGPDTPYDDIEKIGLYVQVSFSGTQHLNHNHPQKILLKQNHLLEESFDQFLFLIFCFVDFL